MEKGCFRLANIEPNEKELRLENMASCSRKYIYQECQIDDTVQADKSCKNKKEFGFWEIKIE
jgi:hypothetical protein